MSIAPRFVMFFIFADSRSFSQLVHVMSSFRLYGYCFGSNNEITSISDALQLKGNIFTLCTFANTPSIMQFSPTFSTFILMLLKTVQYTILLHKFLFLKHVMSRFIDKKIISDRFTWKKTQAPLKMWWNSKWIIPSFKVLLSMKHWYIFSILLNLYFPIPLHIFFNMLTLSGSFMFVSNLLPYHQYVFPLISLVHLLSFSISAPFLYVLAMTSFFLRIPFLQTKPRHNYFSNCAISIPYSAHSFYVTSLNTP